MLSLFHMRVEHWVQLMERNPLDELTEEEMAMVVPVSEEEIKKAIEQGIRDRDLVEEATRYGSVHPRQIFYR